MDIAKRFKRWDFLFLVMAGLAGLSLGVVGMLALQPRKSDDPPVASRTTVPERVLVHSLEGDEQVHRLEGLLQVRRTLQSNEAVLARIHGNAVQQTALINQALQQQFDVEPSGHYFYEKATHAVYRLTASKPVERTTPTTESAATPASELQRQFHRRLASEEEQQKFIGLYAQKQQLLEAVVVFGRALNAQRRQLQQYNQVLTAEFNVEPGRQYVVNSAEDAVYEIRVADPATEAPPQVAQAPMVDNPTVVR